MFLKGYRRNGASARKGIDTMYSKESNDVRVSSVEMELQPERALIHSVSFYFFNVPYKS